jgi:hypothetical protein
MYLLQILLPLSSGGSRRNTILASLHRTLVNKFGGLTAYSRVPAKGKWLSGGKIERDDIVILEVMVKTVNQKWWTKMRKNLERDLEQKEIVIRSQRIEQL